MLNLSIKHHRLSEPLSGEVQQAGSAELPPTARPDASSARDVFRLGLSLIVVGLGASLAVQPSQAAPLPDIVKEPAGIDLGATSFYDALGSVEPTFILIVWRNRSFEQHQRRERSSEPGVPKPAG